MTVRDTLEQALRMPQGETGHRLQEAGIAIATIDSMATAIHDVYCGITADHSHPNDKDRDQARAMLEALHKQPLPDA